MAYVDQSKKALITTSALTVDPADTVHAVTKAICQKLLDKADYLGMLPSTRCDLAAVVADTSQPRYFNYMTFGSVDGAGFERTRTTLRLDFKRVTSLRQTEVASDGARYMVQCLSIVIETHAQSVGVATARLQHLDHARILDIAEKIEAEYGGRDLYLLLTTAEEWVEQTKAMQRNQIAHFIETECKGLRVGSFKHVVCDVATKLPSIAWPRTFVGVEANVTKVGARTYDVSVGNVAVMVTRTL